ncbi:MAG: hypothetical protein JGK27_20215 [Microcoleus sp. PH2017_20_SFW_D_A]|nr:hypothetical protein [Microcoleus sp. PH2017_19_SFW_U_A]MCC3523973.1 hypothetical protein [Microcoleus sp. PH2017_20_SFW_D_A]
MGFLVRNASPLLGRFRRAKELTPTILGEVGGVGRCDRFGRFHLRRLGMSQLWAQV